LVIEIGNTSISFPLLSKAANKIFGFVSVSKSGINLNGSPLNLFYPSTIAIGEYVITGCPPSSPIVLIAHSIFSVYPVVSLSV
jgi:hypothetical protein